MTRVTVQPPLIDTFAAGWVICGFCGAGEKIASRLALRPRPGLDVAAQDDVCAHGQCPGKKTPADRARAAITEIQAEAKRTGADKLTAEEIDAEIKAVRDARKKTPADRLADAADQADQLLRAYGGPNETRDLRAAIDEYRSTRHSAGQTADEALGSPPDPIKIARLLLDALLGEKLS